MEEIPYAVQELIEGLKEAEKEMAALRNALKRIDLDERDRRALEKKLAEAGKRWKALYDAIRELMAYFREMKRKYAK